MAYTLIDDPSAYFQTALYAGNNTTDHNIANDGNSDLQPDLVWIKQRTSNNPHVLQDTSRGFAGNGEANVLLSNSSQAEATNGAFESFNTNGFGVGGTNVASGAYNLSGSNYVAWQWKANGGTTSSNTDGNITSTVQSNQDAGFSIVTYTGNGSNNQTIGHGLGVQPSWWIVKRRNVATNWFIGASSILGGTSNYLLLNSTAANAEINNIWGDSPTSSTLFRVSNNAGLNASGGTYVAYLFANKQGYSKFGSYVGDGNTNGPFVYTGFKPAFVMLKGSSASGAWYMLDSKRDVDNVAHHVVEAQSAAAEYTNYNLIDMLSNGFKLRIGTSEINTSGNSYIYMAFAENPFTTSTGIPTTAR